MKRLSVYCVYGIWIVNENGLYIGSTSNFKSRKYSHKKQLQLDNHYNKELQAVYNKVGNDGILFYIIEKVSIKSKLKLREQYWLDKYRTSKHKYKIYNIQDPSKFHSRHPKHATVVLNEERELIAEFNNYAKCAKFVGISASAMPNICAKNKYGLLFPTKHGWFIGHKIDYERLIYKIKR